MATHAHTLGGAVLAAFASVVMLPVESAWPVARVWPVARAWGDAVPSALAERAQGAVPMPPGFMDGISVVERLGAAVPLDMPFRDQNGRPVTLRSVVQGDLPVLLTFNYSSCPGLCDVHLNAVVDGLAGASLIAGRQFRLVTVVLASDESPARVARTREKYLHRLRAQGREIAGDAWTFLLARNAGDESAIRALADATGFGYRWIAQQGQYAHPATVVVLSPPGKIHRYVHGIALAAPEIDRSVMMAGLSEPSASAGFLMSCFHWNPRNRPALGPTLMRYGGLGFAVLLIGTVSVLLWRRSRHLPGVTPS